MQILKRASTSFAQVNSWLSPARPISEVTFPVPANKNKNSGNSLNERSSQMQVEPMEITRYKSFADFGEHTAAWESISSENPMASPQWAIPWWEAYGKGSSEDSGKELCLLAGFVRDELVGVAPFYIDNANTSKRLRILGDGKVCSDHMSLLSTPDYNALFVTSVHEWMQDEIGKTWNSAHFECVPAEDQDMISLTDRMEVSGLALYQRPNCSSWQVDLPDTWDEYLMRLSKNQRKRCRRWLRQWIETGKLTRKSVTANDDLDDAFEKLCTLHNARRRFLGQAGAFEDQQFFDFHKDATRQLMESDQLRMEFLLDEGRPVTCEYLFTTDNTVFSYQSGYDPEYISIGAGNISLTLAIRSAIEEGYKTFDFLRGGEKYKQSWKADETQTMDIHVNRKNLNGTIEQAKLGTKDWLRSMRDLVKGRS